MWMRCEVASHTTRWLAGASSQLRRGRYSMAGATARATGGRKTSGGHEQLCPAKSFSLSCREELSGLRRPYSKAGTVMARRQLSPAQLQELRDLAAQWGKIISRRAFGDDGPGLDIDLDAMEQIAQAATAGLNEGTLQALL